MRSLRLKLLLAFLAVAFVTVAVLGLLIGRATSGAFDAYVRGRQTGDLAAMGRMMEQMMGPAASQAMLEQMLGPAEQAYLAAIRSALWLAAGLAALVAVALSLLLARQIAAPVRALTMAARRLASGDLEQRVPVRSADELGELAATFNALAAALGRQQALRHQMAADIAHELRTPLAVIQANLEAVLDGVRPFSTEVVADLHEETRLLAGLVTDLRDLSLADAGQLTLRRRATDLASLARASRARFAPRAAAKGVRLTVAVEGGLPPADVDPDRFAQVLGNLLDNAVRHTPPGGEVVVRVGPGPRPDTLEVVVRDNGPGIPAEHLPNIFERFYRADRARARSAGGSGIGLALVKQLVEAHGGQVRVESSVSEGATFGLLLPAANARTDEHVTEPCVRAAR